MMSHFLLVPILVILFAFTLRADDFIGNPSANPSGEMSAAPSEKGNPYFFSVCGKDTVRCACECDDPFDPRTVQHTGLYAGMCLNTCEQRSVMSPGLDLLRKNGMFTDIDPATESQSLGSIIYIANIARYDSISGRFRHYVGRMSTAGLQDVILQIEYHGGMQAHSQLRLRFRPEMPVELVPQSLSDRDTEGKSLFVTDLVYSVEALGPAGVPYKGDFGFKEEYCQAYRLETLDSRARTMIVRIGAPVWQYRIDLTLDERESVLMNILRLAHQWGHENRYHTTKLNCILEVFRVIDASVKYSRMERIWMRLHRLTLFLPTRAMAQLRYRGLINKHKGLFILPDLEDELGLTAFVKLPDLELKKRPR